MRGRALGGGGVDGWWWVVESEGVGGAADDSTTHHSTTPPLPGDRDYSSAPAPASAPEPEPGSPSRPSRMRLRTSWAAALISCIFLRTRVPAALFPPSALATSSAASMTSCFSCSYSCIETAGGSRFMAENCSGGGWGVSIG